MDQISQTAVDKLCHQALAQNYIVARVDVSPSYSKAEFLERCAQALGYPCTPMDNYDAFADMLKDLSWLDISRGVLLCYPEALTIDANEKRLGETVESIFMDIMDFWQARHAKVIVVKLVATKAPLTQTIIDQQTIHKLLQ